MVHEINALQDVLIEFLSSPLQIGIQNAQVDRLGLFDCHTGLVFNYFTILYARSSTPLSIKVDVNAYFLFVISLRPSVVSELYSMRILDELTSLAQTRRR